jgi:hypothetical protein
LVVVLFVIPALVELVEFNAVVALVANEANPVKLFAITVVADIVVAVIVPLATRLTNVKILLDGLYVSVFESTYKSLLPP